MPTQNSKTEFFNPQQVIAALLDWELQTGANPNLTRQRAQALLKNGDQLNAVQYGVQIAYSETYKAKKVSTNPATGQAGHSTSFSDGANYAVPHPGVISNGAHVDSIQVVYSQTDFPALTVAAHKHATAAGVAQNHDACRVYVPTVALPARAIGIPSTLKDTDGNTIFTCPTGVGMKALTYQLQPTHTDEPNGDGGHLAGQNRDGVETLTIEFTGKVDVAELQIAADWMLPDSDTDGQGNTIATTKSITITKHIPYDTEETPDGAEN